MQCRLLLVFLDCVAEEFIQQGKGIKGLERAVRFTESGRALGLGTLGFHTYLQQNMIDIESFRSTQLESTYLQGYQEGSDKG